MYSLNWQMKKKVNHIVILFLAAAIFFVGAGVTIVDLCCSKCADSLLSLSESTGNCVQHSGLMKMPDNCCSEKTNSESLACDSLHSDKDKSECCKKERLSIDLNNTTFKHSLSNTMVWTIISFSNSGSLYLSINDKYIQPEVVEQKTLPPRDYLSLIRILII